MTYWRMQLHPSHPGEALRHAVQSLGAGFIGLDFEEDIGDLMERSQDSLPAKHRDYALFAREMNVGDPVLIIAHHYPFALANVAGPYNFIRESDPQIGVWFRHFRRVTDVRFYGDLILNPRDWERIEMRDAISPLRDRSGASYQLIVRWLATRPGRGGEGNPSE